MKIPEEIKRGWEHRFPSLGGHWTHWKIMGVNKFIALVDGMELTKALKIVESNYGKYITINVCRASVNYEGKILEEEKHLIEISRLENDEYIRVPDDA